ncbi:Pkinase-domain-containing protein [Hesseltinella vesiculosa]|uniref:Pkinase-domain-containing protein n=1 Tax=Hesseltinella vesiculosa TaxID=101127 RepID=A0A1X2GKY5_9FUNG|nr:Pkinase-domain-containing protein [Hesseltinella vesiculosa]
MIGSTSSRNTVLQSEASTTSEQASVYFSCDTSSYRDNQDDHGLHGPVPDITTSSMNKRRMETNPVLERKQSKVTHDEHAIAVNGRDQEATQESDGSFECDLPEWDKHSDAWAFIQSLTGNYESGYLTRQSSEQNSRTGYLFGRSVDCDFVVTRPEISQRHCLIYFVKNGKPDQYGSDRSREFSVYLEDQSLNGTYVNGEKIGKGQRVLLNDGDRIQLYRRAQYDEDDPRHLCNFSLSALTYQPQPPFFLSLVYRIIFPTKFESMTFHAEYRIGGELGKGNFATVYKAMSRADEAKPSESRTYVAVKALSKAKFGRKPRMLKSLVQEISILMSLESHPCVIKINKVFDEPRWIFVVLEFASHGDLFDFVTEKLSLTEEETRFIFFQLFEGTSFLHSRNIVHRDLKLENVLVVDKEKLQIKITDFGLAKMMQRCELLDSQCGTPNYVAPEILDPTGIRAYGNACDIWSLGVMLYICLCGFPPFTDEVNSHSMREQIRQGLYSFPSPSWDNISDDAKNLIDMILTVDPSLRITLAQIDMHSWMQTDSDLLQARISRLGEDALTLFEKYQSMPLQGPTQPTSCSF